MSENPHELANDIHFNTGKALTGLYGFARRITGLANDYPTGDPTNLHMYDRLMREYYRNCDNLGFTGLQTDPVDAGFTPLTITGFFDTGVNTALKAHPALHDVSGRCLFFNTGIPGAVALGTRPMFHIERDNSNVRTFYGKSNGAFAQSFTGGNPGVMIPYTGYKNIFNRKKTFLVSGENAAGTTSGRAFDVGHFKIGHLTDKRNGLPEILGFSGRNIARKISDGSPIKQGSSFGALMIGVHEGEIVEHMQHPFPLFHSESTSKAPTTSGRLSPIHDELDDITYMDLFKNNFPMIEDGVHILIFSFGAVYHAGSPGGGALETRQGKKDKTAFNVFEAKVSEALS